MDLYIKLTDLHHIDFNHFRATNHWTIQEALVNRDVPEEVHIINKVPEMDFCQEFTIRNKMDLLSFPVKRLLQELEEDNSALNAFFETGNADSSVKASLFIRIWEACFQNILDKLNRVYDMDCYTRYDVFYGDPLVDEIGILGGETAGCKSFNAAFPDELIKKYYPNPVCYISCLKDSGLQQFVDVKNFDKDDFLKYVAAPYYRWREALYKANKKMQRR